MTEREKKLRLRRKHAEEIIAWKKKLDDEELQVREIEKKASQVLINKTGAGCANATTTATTVAAGTNREQQQQQQSSSNLKATNLLKEKDSTLKNNKKSQKESEITSSLNIM